MVPAGTLEWGCRLPSAAAGRVLRRDSGLLDFVPLLGMVGYGATVCDLLPTYLPKITEHGALGGSDLPPCNIYALRSRNKDA